MKTKINKIHLALVPVCMVLLLLVMIIYKQVSAGGQAQWPNTTSPTADFLAANGSDSRGTLTSDGYFILAIDTGNIVIQKYDADGTAYWNGGTPITITGSLSITEVVADESGGAFIAHTGPTVSSQNDYVSHVTSSGTINWTAGPFNNTAVADYYPRILYDGNGGVFVTWYISSSGYTGYVTHLGSDGDVCDTATCGYDWNSGGSGTYRKVTMPVATGSTSYRPQQKMVLSDSGSMLVTYQMSTGFITTKIDADGDFTWSGIPTYGNYQKITDYSRYGYVEAQSDGSNGTFVAYFDKEANPYELKLARINSSGSIVLGSGSGGTIVKTLPSGANTETLVSDGDGSGNIYLGWHEYISSEYNAYVQKYNTSGTEQWTTGGVLIGSTGDDDDDRFEWTNQINLPHTLAYDGSGGVVLVINRYNGSSGYSWTTAQRVNSAGYKVWGATGLQLSDDTNMYDWPEAIISDGSGGAFCHWYRDDYSVSNEDGVYGQFVETITGPTIGTIVPDNGPVTGGTTVTINGSGFVSGATVEFGGTASSSVSFISSSQITAEAPAHAAGTVDIVVENPDTGMAVKEDAFTYNTVPLVTGVVDIHIQSVDTQGDYMTVGINDGNTGSEYENSLGTPSNTGLSPSPPQAVRYTFDSDGNLTASSTTYELSDMTGATSLGTSMGDEDLSAQVNIGFNVNIYGRYDNVLKAHSDGLLFVNDSTVAYGGGDLYSYMDEGMNSSYINGTSDHVMAVWTDLEILAADDIKYKTFGTTPNRIFVVEFDDVNYYGETTGGNTFQFKFYETAPAAPGEGDIITTTNINNEAPVFSVDTAESWTQTYTGTATTDARTESSATYPTNEGLLITFTGTATDANDDQYYLIVCASAGAVAGTDAAPTCSGGGGDLICVSGPTAESSAASCTYDTTGVSAQTDEWWSYACDKLTTGASCSDASDTSSGGTADEPDNYAGSPFHVNHVPTFTPTAISAVDPNGTLVFANTTDADGDTQGTQDTFSLYVCPGESDMGGVTQFFDARALTCRQSVDGTANTARCSDTGNGTGDNATCNDTQNTVSAPTAEGTYDVVFYVVDSHGFAATGSTQSFSVNDVDPVWVSNGITAAPTTPIAEGSATTTLNVAFSDNNGDQDPTYFDMVFFDDAAVNDDCSADENNCFRFDNENLSSPANCTVNNRSTTGSGKTASGEDINLDVTCTFTYWFNANASEQWKVGGFATDAGDGNSGDVNFTDSSGLTIGPITALDVTESEIDYGSLIPGDDSTYSAATSTNIKNVGNQVIDVLLGGTYMALATYSGNQAGCAAAVDCIDQSQQQWNHTDADFTWGTGNTLVQITCPPGAGTCGTSGEADDGCLDRNMAVRNVHDTGTEDESIAWKLRIPILQGAGSYSGTNTFSASADSTCDDGPY